MAKKSRRTKGPTVVRKRRRSAHRGMLTAIRRELTWYEQEFYRGNRLMILYAIERSCRSGVPLSPGFAEEVTKAIRLHTHFKVKTLDEAFGIKRRRGENTGKRRWYVPDLAGESPLSKLMHRIRELVEIELAKGRKPKVTAIRKQVAKELNLSERTVLAMTSEANKPTAKADR